MSYFQTLLSTFILRHYAKVRAECMALLNKVGWCRLTPG